MESITILQYAKLTDTTVYDAVLPFLKPKNKMLDGKIDFNILTYSEVRKCLELMKKMDTWDKQKDLFELAYGIKTDDKKKTKTFWDCPIDEYFSALNYLTVSFKKLLEREARLLKSINHNADLWEQAGGKRLDKFSNLMPLLQLGEIYGIYPYDLKDKPYNEILTLLVAHKEKAEINYEYDRLRTKT
jgi:hypothetical protein